MGRRRQVVLFAAFAALLASSALPGAFQVVVHPTVEGSKIKRSILADIYKKDVIRWGNQVRIRPVDQSSQTPVRQAFIQDVLGQSLGEIQEYWTQRLATERELPPPTKPSDDEVLAFVASKKGAIGYVSADVEVPADVKVIALID
jgi:ABC-type phosphate transport system substrate-binding protein